MSTHNPGFLLNEYLREPLNTPVPPELASHGIALLPVIESHLRTDSSIDRTEAVENVLKSILKPMFQQHVTGPMCRQIALFQNSYRFALKYKSYAVKAATPLGYSIFLQAQDQGFSFQQHITHKTEVFHVLATTPGAYVFLCEFADWRRQYEPERFGRWLSGSRDQFFDQRAFRPSPGDVFVISELGVVHTVIGCVLEEFATVSTDMVERLHDQNIGRPIPPHFTRAYAESELLRLALPQENRLVDPATWTSRVIPRTPCQGGSETVLADSFLRASHRRIEVGRHTEMRRSGNAAAIIRVFSGHGTLWLADDSELGRLDDAAMNAGAGDVFLIPPGAWYGFRNDGPQPLTCSEHRIDPKVAFV
jgi:mannose-6-phosphate isomerase-like protein (cupin superfamily)